MDEQHQELVTFYDRVFDPELRVPITSLPGLTFNNDKLLNIPDVDQVREAAFTTFPGLSYSE